MGLQSMEEVMARSGPVNFEPGALPTMIENDVTDRCQLRDEVTL